MGRGRVEGGKGGGRNQPEGEKERYWREGRRKEDQRQNIVKGGETREGKIKMEGDRGWRSGGREVREEKGRW